MFDILQVIPGRKRKTRSGWTTFNAPCCAHRGHRPDRRSRGGIKFAGATNWNYHCFNCGYVCDFTLGKPLHKRTSDLLVWCGCDIDQVGRWSLQSLTKRDVLEIALETQPQWKPEFDLINIPEQFTPIDPKNSWHQGAIQYLRKRCVDIERNNFHVQCNEHGWKRILIPYYYKHKIVGYTVHTPGASGKTPKYLNTQQRGFVFGLDRQHPTWSFVIVVEGIFDALSIDGLALTHNTISAEQAYLINRLQRRVIVVPDHDSSGMQLLETAHAYGWSVSIPPWPPGIKDVNDAVIKWGKLPTLLSIVQHATTSRIITELARKKYVR